MSQNIELKNFELATVNPSNKTWTSIDLFCFWANSIQTIAGFALIASLYLIYNLNTVLVLTSSLAASILIYFFISKSITYLIIIFIYYNLDSQILDGQVFFAFFLGLNIIDRQTITTAWITFSCYAQNINGLKWSQILKSFKICYWSIYVWYSNIFYIKINYISN